MNVTMQGTSISDSETLAHECSPQHGADADRGRKLVKIMRVMKMKARQDPFAFCLNSDGVMYIEEQLHIWLDTLKKHPEWEPLDHWASPTAWDHSHGLTDAD